MTAQEHILQRLEGLGSIELSHPAPASQKDLVDVLFASIMSKKFRKYSVSPEYQAYIRFALESNIAHNEPIKIAFPFGGYKLWRFKEAPEVDWAELFTLMYYAAWLKPLAAAYEPGIWFDFSSDEVIVERINNIPVKDTGHYAQSFLGLRSFLEAFIPKNIRFTLTPVRSRYTPEEFEQELQQHIEALRTKWQGLPTLNEEQKRMIELNVRLKTGQGEERDWREQTQLVLEAYHAMSKRRPYFRAPDKILAFATDIGNCIPVGTAKTSVAKFWAGVGALKKHDDSFREYVLSPSQLHAAECRWEGIELPGLEGRNFQQIRIIAN